MWINLQSSSLLIYPSLQQHKNRNIKLYKNQKSTVYWIALKFCKIKNMDLRFLDWICHFWIGFAISGADL